MNAKELRKKRILENAEARLAKLRGIYSSNQPEQPQAPSLSSEAPPNILPETRSDHSSEEIFRSPAVNTSRLDEPIISGRILDLLTSSQGTAVKKSWKNQLAFAILGVLTRLAFFFGYEDYFGQVILIPFLVVSIPNLIQMGYNLGEPEGSFHTALVLIGVSTNIRRIVVSGLFLVRRVLVNFSFYMFTFTLTHWFIEEMAVS